MQQISLRESKQQSEQIKKIANQMFNEKNIDPDSTCFKCGKHDFKLSMKIIPTGRSENYPKYIPQIRQDCANCGIFKKWAVQTLELIAEFNRKLEGIEI